MHRENERKAYIKCSEEMSNLLSNSGTDKNFCLGPLIIAWPPDSQRHRETDSC